MSLNLKFSLFLGKSNNMLIGKWFISKKCLSMVLMDSKHYTTFGDDPQVSISSDHGEIKRTYLWFNIQNCNHMTKSIVICFEKEHGYDTKYTSKNLKSKL